MPEHVNFISLIKDRVEVRLPNGDVAKFPIEFGILHCRANIVEVFTGLSQLSVVELLG